VVSAAGALQTPALLLRSGLESKTLGKNLRLHPVMVVWGQMEEEVRPWEGMLSATFSDQHANIHDGYGVKYEHVATPPSILLSFSPWRGGRAHQELMQALPYTAGIGVLLRDHGVGEVRVGRDGEPIVRYAFTDRDVMHLRTGIAGGAELVEAMGAKLIYSSHAGWVAYQPGRSGDRVSFMRDADACGWGPGQTQPVSFHIMGSARMGGSEADSVCDPNGQTWAVRDLYVCDGSAFPTATGVNPMVTIEALAHMNARGLAERLA
jgi:choline dehydrogenase-like flavoprotein